MTPEKLEAWAEYFEAVKDDHEDYAQLAALLTRLAAKMREPDGWHAIYDADLEYGYKDVVLGEPREPDPRADSCRPILYLDSLEGDDG